MKKNKVVEVSSQRKIKHISETDEDRDETSKNISKRNINLKKKNPSHLTLAENKHIQLSSKYIRNQPEGASTSNQTPILELISGKKNCTVESNDTLKGNTPHSKQFTNNTAIESNCLSKREVYSSRISKPNIITDRESSHTNILLPLSLTKCILCSRIYPINMIVTTGLCNHFYCQKCIKQLFRKQMYYYRDNSNSNDNDINSFKCPITNCNEYFQNGAVTTLFPCIYSIMVTGKDNNNWELIDEQMVMRENRQENNNQKSIQYDKGHVIDINNNKKLFFFIKNNENACPFCFDNRTFNKKSTHFFICLNCLKSFCKYCRKAYDELHFEQATNENYCRIYYRKDKRTKTDNALLKFIMSVILVIMSYLMIHIGFVLTISRALYCSRKKSCRSKVYRVIIISAIGVIYIAAFPFFILMLPYYPLITIF